MELEEPKARAPGLSVIHTQPPERGHPPGERGGQDHEEASSLFPLSGYRRLQRPLVSISKAQGIVSFGWKMELLQIFTTILSFLSWRKGSVRAVTPRRPSVTDHFL